MRKACYIVQTEFTFEIFKNKAEAEEFLNESTATEWAGNIEMGLDNYIKKMNIFNVKEEELPDLIAYASIFMCDTEKQYDIFYRNGDGLK